MGEFAGVDPQRVRDLANRLRNLADAIAQNGSIIRSNFSKWGGTLDLGQLARQAAQVGQDARDMALRADEALNLLHEPGGLRLTSAGLTVSIPWDTKGINTTKEAQQEAFDFKNSLEDPKGSQSRQIITEVAQSLADHQGDSVYLKAFVGAGGMNCVAEAARALHEEDVAHRDGVVLSAESQRILGQFGHAVAGVAKSGALPDFNAFTEAPDLWSSSMILKYGPNGQAYGDGPGKEFLAAMSRTVLDHLHDHRMVTPVPATTGRQDYDQKLQSLEVDFNGPSAVLNVAAQNGGAAREVLGDLRGDNYAKIIEAAGEWNIPSLSGGSAYTEGRFGTNPEWSIPSVDISGAAASFMTAATIAPRGSGADSQQAAQAVANIAKELPSPTGDDAFVEPAAIQSALAGMMRRYRFDIANSALVAGQPGAVQYLGDPNGPWLVNFDTGSLQNLIEQGLHDPVEYGKFRQDVTADVGTAAGYAARGGDMGPLRSSSSLLGVLQRYQNALLADAASRQDAQAAARVEADSIIQGGLGAGLGLISLPADGPLAPVVALNITQLVNSMSSPVVQENFNTGHSLAAIQAGDDAFFETKEMIWYPIALGLVNQGVVPQPPRELLVDGTGKMGPNSQLFDWVESKLKAKAANDPQFKAQLGSQNILGNLVNTAQDQIDHSQ
jgi:hypothetical protein